MVKSNLEKKMNVCINAYVSVYLYFYSGIYLQEHKIFTSNTSEIQNFRNLVILFDCS